MLMNRPKTELITTLFVSRNEDVCQNVIKLLDMLISEIRVENDFAEGNVLIQNQGKIKAYLALQEFIERGLPTTQR